MDWAERVAATIRHPATCALVIEAARAHAFDLYLSALLAPRDARDDLMVLAAFEGEIDRIPHVVSEPMLAEIRLQWWRDRIAASPTGELSGNPIADALIDVVTRHGLDIGALIDSIDARSPVSAAPRDAQALERRALATDRAAMLRAARVLGVTKPDADDTAFLAAAGLAVTHARELVAGAMAPVEAGASRSRDGVGGERHDIVIGHLRRARALLPGRGRAVRLSALPLALVGPYLRAWEKGEISQRPFALMPIERVWRLWWFARTARL